MKVIEIENISKDYGNHKGVFDVSFFVEKGEVLGFLGPNGAGKTTTIRQLMGFIKPDKGSVKIAGMDCFQQASKIQSDLGYLPGEIAFMEDMKGDEFIHFIAKMKGMKDFLRAEELMNFFELDAKGKIKKMSKGMKQKIGIVCAFMQDSDILILDEPTSGLDPLMQNKFVELILSEKKKGKTILMSSHIFEEIEKTCDRAAIIRDGCIVSVERIEKLKQQKQKKLIMSFQKEEEAKAFEDSVLLKQKEISKTRIHREGSVVTVHVTGNMDEYIKKMSLYEIKDLEIHTQTLEELFLHFYGGAGK
ncbi:MAG: ABC transporter ATP-binding protein [Velocimicrobium sp.]